MNCQKVISRLHANVDGELPEALRREMDEHLGSCPACRSEVERIKEMGDILDSLTVPGLPGGFAARVLAEARKKTPPAKKKKSFSLPGWHSLRWFCDLSVAMRLAVCAMLLVTCLLGAYMSRQISLAGNRRASVAKTESLEGFEWFSSTPPASLGSAYLALALRTREDQGRR